MRRYWFTLVLLVLFALSTIFTIRNFVDLVEEQESRIEFLERELNKPIPECIPPGQLSVSELMDAFTRWTPMTAAELEYWREEENRG